MIDRGPSGIPMIQNTMHHPNMIPFWSNHEEMFYHIISKIGKKLSLLEKASIKCSFLQLDGESWWGCDLGCLPLPIPRGPGKDNI